MADRKYVLSRLAIFADRAAMKRTYGMEPDQAQVDAANKTLDWYRSVSDKELAAMPDEKALRWPYRPTPAQMLDMAVHEAGIEPTVAQSAILRELKAAVAGTGASYRDAKAVEAALRDVEGAMLLNVYLGEFSENRDLLGNVDGKLATLFTAAYEVHHATR